MAAINRNITRTILDSTEKTLQTSSPSSDTLAFNLTASTQKFYIGFKERFQSRYFLMSVANVTTSVVTIKYWNGTSYQAVADVVDMTVGFTRSGFISWENKSDWQLKAQSGVSTELYWVELTVSVTLHASTVLQCVENIFCDDALLGAYYPELISDTGYLPPGKLNFMAQYIAAKDLVVSRLKRDRIIEDESQILDINQVSIAATRATAWIIYSAIVTAGADQGLVDKIFADFQEELNQSKLSFDYNNSGIIDEHEKNTGSIVICRR